MKQKPLAMRVSVTKIGGYPIVEKIGKGGTGMVYKGTDPMTGQEVAIKVLAGELATDPILRMRFAQECKVTKKLNHPNIVRVLDFGLDGAKPYLVMEYVDGESMGQRLDREGRLPIVEALRVVKQVGQALHWAHQRRIVHRDVKPDNILLTAEGQAKLSDLGLVKDLESDFNLTRTQSFLGTPHFMAPEQFEDAKRVDALSDLYSLAATLYMAITGELPFRGRSSKALIEICKKKLLNDITPPRELVPELGAHVESAILRALRADRDERQTSVLGFLESLWESASAPAPTVYVDTAPTVKESSSMGDRRENGRRSSRRSTSCRAVQRIPDQPWEGKVVNLSQTGVCLELSRRFEKGSLLTVIIESDKIQRKSLVVRVRWVKQKSPDAWQLGCQFDQSLCDFEVEELI